MDQILGNLKFQFSARLEKSQNLYEKDNKTTKFLIQNHLQNDSSSNYKQFMKAGCVKLCTQKTKH